MHIAIAAPIDKFSVHKFLDDELEYLPNGYSGAPFIATLVNQLLIQDYKVTAITTDNTLDLKSGIKQFSKGHFTWIVIPARKHAYRFNDGYPGRIMDLFSLERKNIVETIYECSPDIVHAHWSYEFAWAAVKSGYPHLVTVHDNPYKVLKYTVTAYRFLRLLMAERTTRKARFVSTVSPYMEEYCKKRSRNYRIIPNPLPMNFKVASNPKKLEKDLQLFSPVITMVFNGWGKRKNGNAGLQAFKRIQEKFPSAELWLFGKDTEKGGIAEKVSMDLQLSRVSFGGAVTHAVLREKLEASTMVLHPALEESFGVSIIEAMALGVPVIGGARSGAVPWVINNEHLLADVESPSSIANKAMDILCDNALYFELSTFCIENTINRFSSETVTNEYLQYYKLILNN